MVFRRARQGQCVGIVELGGGFRPADLKTYFTKLKVGSPKVLAVSVDHGTNAPSGSANGADGEVMLDIEVVGSVAPAANIAVYFAPNTDAGFVDAVTSAIHDTTNKPSVISISWGSAESTWTAQAMTAMDDAFQAAASMALPYAWLRATTARTTMSAAAQTMWIFPPPVPSPWLRRYQPASFEEYHFERSRLERRLERRRYRRRRSAVFFRPCRGRLVSRRSSAVAGASR